MSIEGEPESVKRMRISEKRSNADSYRRVAVEAKVRGDDYAVATKIIEHIARAFSEGRPILLSETDLRILAGKGSSAEISERLGDIVARTTAETESAERAVADCRIMQDIALEGTEKASAA
ncbi:hypothetical protein HZB74_03990 [Candidatus Saccharibacteria bacterium]|nr:hypothetical protein [Candidatus Saccharibacteria bacterium]